MKSVRGLDSLSMRREDYGIFLIIGLCILLCCIVGTCILYDDNCPSYYRLLPLLPFSFAILPIIYPMLFKQVFHNLGVALLVSGYFMRNVISPFVMMFGEYYGVFKLNIDENMPWAILLMTYETFVVFGITLIYIQYIYRKNKDQTYQSIYINHSTNIRVINLMLLVITFFCIGIALAIPSARQSFSNIFDKDLASMSVDMDSIAVRGGMKRALVTLFQMCVGFLRYLVPTYFIIEIRRRGGENGIGILLSLPFILLQFFVISETLAYSIFGALISMLLIIKIYPSKAKFLIFAGGILGALGVSYFVFIKTVMLAGSDEASMSSLSAILQAYFPGCCNMAGVFNVENPNKFKTLFYDIYYCIPFRGTLFGLNEVRLASLYNESNGIAANIMPAAGHAYHYLGAVLAPIEPAVMGCFGAKYGEKIKCQSSVWHYVAYTYLVIVFSISPVMFNLSNLLSLITLTFVPMYLITGFEGKKEKKKKTGTL